MSVCEDRHGTLWIGTWAGGLNELKDGKISAFGVSSGLSSDLVLALLEGRDGSLWIGLDHGAGLNRFKGGPPNVFPRLPGLIPAAIRALHEDRHGWLWVGTSRGLNILKDGQVHRVHHRHRFGR